MKPLPLIASSLVLAAGAAAFVVQYRALQALRADVAALRVAQQQTMVARTATVGHADGAVATADAPVLGLSPTDRADLVRLHDEIAALRKDSVALTQVVQAVQARTAEAAMPTKLVPVAQWKNSGRATPQAAAETVLWAAVSGEVGTIADSITLTPGARDKAEALFTRLPPDVQSKYGTADNLVALMIAKDAGSVAGMQVLGQRELSADDVGMRIRFGSEDGKTKDDSFLLRRSGDGWKVVIPESPIDNWARQLRGGK